ncbi:MAG: O-antigen ligase family protein [Desulfobulbaceae bacterium]|nr:O-antigen ligase family protein [Desulfobulbaceae bacterium]HIJ91203.1 hypothetical protein [Deltaproteobacteria bacterium]
MKKTILLYSCIVLVLAGVAVLLRIAGIDTTRGMVTYLLPVAVVLLGMAAVYNPESIFYLVLASLPFAEGLLKFEIGSVTFNIYTIGMVALGGFCGWRIITGTSRLRFIPQDIAILLLCVLYLGTTLNSTDVIGSGFLAFHAIFIPVVSFYVLRIYVTTEERFWLCFRFFCLGIILFSVAGISQFFVNKQRLEVLSVPPVGAATFFLIPVLFAKHLATAKKIKLTIFLLSSVAFILTFTRVYLFLLFLSPIIYFLIRRGFARLLIFLMLLFSLFATLTLSYSVYTPEEFDTLNLVEERQEYAAKERMIDRMTDPKLWKRALVGRALSYREGLNNFIKHPIVGTGLYKGVIVKGGQKYGMITRHNFHVEWLEYGGIAGYMASFFFVMLYFSRLANAAKHHKILALNLVAVFVILCNSLTNGFMHGVMPLVTFIMMGFGVSYYWLIRREVLSGEL